MRATTLLAAATVAVAVISSVHWVRAEEEAPESEAPFLAADHLGTLRYALVIGINDYADDGISDLRHRESNARAVFSVLMDSQTGGVPTANVQSLLGAEATAAKIREALGRLRDLPKEATVFVYFSGHGAMKGEDAYWVTQDSKADDIPATAIAAPEIRQLLDDLQAERICLMMDCCHGETLVGKGRARAKSADILARYHGKGHATLGAAGSEEHSITDQEVERSVFTHYLVEGLAGEAELREPWSVCVDSLGNVTIADTAGADRMLPMIA